MLIPFRGQYPHIDPDVFIAPTATIIGQVTVSTGASIWFGTVIRGDVDKITIGSHTNIQDNCVLHVDPGMPLAIGDCVTVGHRCVLHGCHIGNSAVIGMGSLVLNGAIVGEQSLVAAGSVVTEATVIPPRTLVAGSPARVKRELQPEEIERYRQLNRSYCHLAHVYRNAYITLSPSNNPAPRRGSPPPCAEL